MEFDKHPENWTAVDITFSTDSRFDVADIDDVVSCIAPTEFKLTHEGAIHRFVNLHKTDHGDVVTFRTKDLYELRRAILAWATEKGVQSPVFSECRDNNSPL